MAVSVIDQEIVSLLFEILSAVQRQEQIQLLQDVKTLVNGMVGLLGQTFAQSLSNGYKLDQLAGKANALQSQLQSVSSTQQAMFTAVEALPADTTSAVWSQLVYPNYIITMADVMRFLEQYEEILDFSGAFELWSSPYFLLGIGTLPGTKPPQMPIKTPVWDFSQAQPGDTLLTFVSRLNSYVSWAYYTGSGDHVWGEYNDGAGSIWIFITRLDEAAFQLLKRAYLKNGSAPVWPGVAGVVFGTQQAITPPTQSVAGPMDGVVVNITGGTANLPHFKIGTIDSWKAVGTIMFVNDNGDAETFELLGPAQAMYVPRAMSQAASAQFKWLPGITGTVTPWTIA